MNAVIYARYSSERQNEKSIDDQIKACEEYANNHDLNVIKVYMDKAMSGKNDNRPGFQQMLRDSKEKRFKVVLCWKLDRIGRNAADYFINEKTLENNGVKIESITEIIPEGAAAPIIKGIYVGQAESYNINLALNVLRGMEGNAKLAKSNGAIHPYGLTVDKNRDYIIDEEQAPFIRMIFKLFVEDRLSFYEIAEHINSYGQLTNRGKPFTGQYIKRILKNPKYKGLYTFNDTVIEGGIPAIIDEDTFEKAQAILGLYSKTFTQRKKPENFMLLGKLFCANCGSALVASSGTSKSGKVYRYYLCKNRKKKSDKCIVKPIRKDLIDSFIIEVTHQHVLQDDVIEIIADYAMQLQKESNEELTIKKIKKDIRENQNQIDNLMKLLMQGWSSDELRIQLMSLEEQKKSLNTALQLAELNKCEIDRDAIVWLLNKFKEIKDPESELAREMVNTLINSILVDNETVTIVYNYGENKKDTETYTLDMLQCSYNSQMVNRQLIKLNFNKDFFYIQVERPAA